MDVAAFFQIRRGFGGDVPRSDNLETRSPEDAYQVAPDSGVLMREHHALHTVVGHVLGHRLVGGDHTASEVFVSTSDGQCTARIPHPVIERLGRALTQPSDEELCNLVVVHRIGIRRISDPEFGVVLERGGFLVIYGQVTCDAAR